MEKYDYLYEVADSVESWLKENNYKVTEANRQELTHTLLNILWDNDNVTGAKSGSFFCNRDLAEKCLFKNIDLLGQAIMWAPADLEIMGNPELCDVLIRQCVLPTAVVIALDNILHKED